MHLIPKKWTLALCTIAIWRINQQRLVIASDTDILTLFVHIFGSRLPGLDWFLQTNKNQFVNVSKIHDYVGNAVAITFPITSSQAMIQWVTCTVSPRRLHLNGCWNKTFHLLSFYQIWESIPISRRRQKKSWKDLSRYFFMVCML